MRITRSVVAALVLLAACSSADDAAPETTATPTSVASTAPPTTIAPATTAPPEPAKVAVTVDHAGEMNTTELELDETTTRDPFGTFASCSGSRDVVGTYSMLVSDPSWPLGSVSLITDGVAAGTDGVAATARVGQSGEIDGLLTLADDLTSGTFTSDPRDVVDLTIEFECSGAEPELYAADELAFEVIALLRRAGEERLLTLALPAGSDVECSATGVDIEPSVADPARFGSLSGVRAGEDGVTLTIGDTEVAFPEVRVSDFRPRVGSFAAIAPDGTELDGAYSC